MSRWNNNRTPMSRCARSVQRMTRLIAFAEKHGIPHDEAADQLDEMGKSVRKAAALRRERRDFLKKSGALTLGGALATRSGLAFANPPAANDSLIAVVGGGLAGLRAAHALLEYDDSLNVQVYEGNVRLGGRCYTERGFFDDDMHAELGGQLINFDQRCIQRLCHSLGIPLEDVTLFDDKDVSHRLNGHHVSAASLQDQWVDDGYWKVFKDALAQAPWPPLYNDHGPGHVALDNMTVSQWLDHVGIMANSDFGKLMQSTQLAEYGLEADEASALNLIYILAWNGKNLDPIEGSEVAYQIEGGNDTLVKAMAAALGKSRISTEKELIALGGDAEGPYHLYFADGTSVTAPKVILALPHTTLREVDIQHNIWNSFSAEKQTLIQSLAMASSNKIHLQFDRKFFLDPYTASNGIQVDPNGDIYTDPGRDTVNCAWDEAIGQYQQNPSDKGLMVCFPSGERAAAMHSRGLNVQAHPRDIDLFTAQLDQVIPGAMASLSRDGSSPTANLALASNWDNNHWSRGAYASFHPGQWTSTHGAGQEIVGNNLHFAGEYTDVENGGFLEGAIASGERAAREVYRSL